jgi:hypothetical protein
LLPREASCHEVCLTKGPIHRSAEKVGHLGNSCSGTRIMPEHIGRNAGHRIMAVMSTTTTCSGADERCEKTHGF